MTWPAFWQFVICVILGAWLRGGKPVPGQQVAERLLKALGDRVKGKNGSQELPELPRTGV